MPLVHAPAPESPTATSPGQRRKPKRKEKPVRVQRYYFIEEKRAADEMSRRVISIKKRRANAILKKAYLYRSKNMKKLRKSLDETLAIPTILNYIYIISPTNFARKALQLQKVVIRTPTRFWLRWIFSRPATSKSKKCLRTFAHTSQNVITSLNLKYPPRHVRTKYQNF